MHLKMHPFFMVILLCLQLPLEATLLLNNCIDKFLGLSPETGPQAFEYGNLVDVHFSPFYHFGSCLVIDPVAVYIHDGIAGLSFKQKKDGCCAGFVPEIDVTRR